MNPLFVGAQVGYSSAPDSAQALSNALLGLARVARHPGGTGVEAQRVWRHCTGRSGTALAKRGKQVAHPYSRRLAHS